MSAYKMEDRETDEATRELLRELREIAKSANADNKEFAVKTGLKVIPVNV